MSERSIQIIFFSAVSVGLLILSFFIFKPYLAMLALSAILAVTFYPLYEKFVPKFKHKGAAALFTIVIIVLAIIIPIGLLSAALLKEAIGLYNELAFGGGAEKLIVAINALINRSEQILSIKLLDTSGEVSSIVRDLLSWLIDHFDSVFAAIFGGLFKFVLLILTLYYMFIYGDDIRKAIVVWSPLPDKYDKEFLSSINLSIDAVVRGRLIVSIAQGFLLGLGFFIFNIPNPVFWGFIGVLASLVPILGTALVTIPASIYLLVSGHVGAGIGLLVWGALLVGLVDNILSFFFFKGKINVHPLLVLLSILGGIELFGVAGFLFGPVIVGALLSLLKLYPYIMSKGENHT